VFGPFVRLCTCLCHLVCLVCSTMIDSVSMFKFPTLSSLHAFVVPLAQFFFVDPISTGDTDPRRRPVLADLVKRKLTALSFVRPDCPVLDTVDDLVRPGSADQPFWAADDGNFRTGSLAAAASFWEDTLLPASSLSAREQAKVLGWVRDGVDVASFFRPFQGEYEGVRYDQDAPPLYHARNLPVLPEHESFVSDTIADYVRSGAVRVVLQRPHMLHPIGVAVNPGSGKLRMILDARALNLFTPSDRMRYETLGMFREGIGAGDNLFSLDHKSGYHHVGLQAASCKYFGFQWKRCMYVFTVLPFGWAPACSIYNTLSSVVASYYRTFGIHCIFYLDDFGFAVAWYMSRRDSAEVVWCVVAVMYLAGFYLSRPKSCLLPKPIIELLGFVVDARAQCFRVPERKIVAMLALVDVLVPGSQIELTALQSIVGKAQSLSLAAPPVSIYLRSCYDVLAQFELRAPTRRRMMVTLPAMAVQDLQELRFLRDWDRLSIWRPERHFRIETDASDKGWGAAFYGEERVDVAGRFNEHQLGHPIHIKEAWAVARALEHFEHLVPRNCYLDVYVDNVIVEYALLRGSSPGDVMRGIARTMLAWQLERNVVIRLHRISTHANVVADRLSRFKKVPLPGAGEQRLCPLVFRELMRISRMEFTIDVCANEHNTQLPRFMAREPTSNVGCVTVDAFASAFKQEHECLYCFPPFILLSPLWLHFKQRGCVGVMLFPKQPHKSWYGILMRDARAIGTLARKGDGSVLLAAPAYIASAGPLPWDLCYAVFDFRVPPDVPRL
jgi:hypothetical protein